MYILFLNIHLHQIISVEHRHVPEGKDAVVNYMNASGYHLYRETKDKDGTPNDVIFVRKDFDFP